MLLPGPCHALAMLLPCYCYVLAMLLPCIPSLQLSRGERSTTPRDVAGVHPRAAAGGPRVQSLLSSSLASESPTRSC